MYGEFEKVILAANEELMPCPMCGGTVMLIDAGWDWDPASPRHAKYRCMSCGGLFEYYWGADPWKKTPNALQWWNIRADIKPKTCAGYSTEQLLLVADLLKENDIQPEDLRELCNNMKMAVDIAHFRMVRETERHLQEYLARNKQQEDLSNEFRRNV